MTKKEAKANKLYYVGGVRRYKRLIIYNFLYKIPVISMYLDFITRCYFVFCPDNSKENKTKALNTFLLIFSISVLEIYFIFLRDPTMFRGIITIIITVIVNNEILYLIMRNAEIRLLVQMIEFFSDVRHFYYQYKAIDYAIQDATNKAKREMKAHGKKMYEVITSGDIEKEVRRYNETIQFSYLKLFLSLCIQVIDMGDEEWDGQSIFQMNLHHLKSEVQMEELKQRKMIYIFSGLIFMTVSPLLTLDLCKNFGLSNLPELTEFYYGFLGISIYVISIILSVICYVLQNHQRDSLPTPNHSNIILTRLSNNSKIQTLVNRYTERNYTKMLRLKNLLKDAQSSLSYPQFLIKQLFYGITTLLFCFLFFLNIRQLQIENSMEINLDSNSISMYSDAQINKMKEDITFYINLYKKEDITLDEIRKELEDVFQYSKEDMNEYVINYILTKITWLRNKYFKWYELLISLMSSYLCSKLPYILLLYRKKMMEQSAEQEVVQFQSIILMLMYLENISVLTILQTMEIYALLFKTSIQKCINEFNSGSEEALLQLKLEQPHLQFQRLVDNLLVSDNIGIVKAFDEIASERLFFMERRKQENEIAVRRKQDSATVIAYLPFIFIMLFYLILPFMIQSYRDYQMITMEMY